MQRPEDLDGAIELGEAVEDEPQLAFDEAMQRISGILADFRGDGELLTYMRHVRRGAIEAMMELAEVDPDDKTEIIALQSRIGAYLGLCKYVSDIMGYARAGKLAEAIEDGEDAKVQRHRSDIHRQNGR